MTEIELSDNAKWYCAVTNPNCLRRAELGLSSVGVRNFTPKIRKWSTLGRFRRPVEQPVLGRYIFVELDYPAQSFGLVRNTPGIESLITNQGQPVAIPSYWVEDMMRRYLAGEWDFVRQDQVEFRNYLGFIERRTNDPLSIGDRIRIMTGEFDDMLAFVTGTRKGQVAFKLVGSRQYGTLSKWLVRAA